MSSSAHSELPTECPCAAKNGKHIAPPISSVSASSRKAVDHGDLVRHLRSAEDGHERARRVLEHAGKCLHLALEQVPGGAIGDELGHSHGRRVGAVGGAERVVDIHIGQLRESRRQLRVVLGLAGLIADVLKHQYVARRQVVGKRAHLVADDGRGEHNVGAGQLGQPVGGGPQRQLGLAVLRPAEVRRQDDSRPSLPQLLDRRQRRPDARVVGDRTVVQRNIEVDPDEHALAL